MKMHIADICRKNGEKGPKRGAQQKFCLVKARHASHNVFWLVLFVLCDTTYFWFAFLIFHNMTGT